MDEAKEAPPTPSPETAAADQREGSDRRADFDRLTHDTPRQPDLQQAFMASRLHMLRTHPEFDVAARSELLTHFTERLGEPMGAQKVGPIPGGVGYGMFYNGPFKTDFLTGTSAHYEIVCPTPPGGNVNTYLYLTSTNRSALGVEAFVAYNGQNQVNFMVFDWARYPNAAWQTNVPLANLQNYLRTVEAHGRSYQELPVQNSTFTVSGANWRNEVRLHNHTNGAWDLVYQFDYPATADKQKTGWVGSWAGIVETFQDSYNHTNPMGMMQMMVTSRGSNGQWGPWNRLSPTNSNVRTDNKGFQPVFLDPNYSFVVKS